MNLKELRQQSGKSVKETANVLDCACSTYYGYESGEREIGLWQVLKLSKFFDCSERDIIEAYLNSRSSR